ncbi:MAG TPA: succinate--CoA ligase subunit alpha [Candidatus Xenobia bacterium]|jgi:succinyl-CoA synthetase alpha subunit
MSILVNRDTRVVVQGITGGEGRFHTSQMLAYGTRIVGGVTPGKGGQVVENVPVFNTVAQAVKETGGIDASVIFVPPPTAADAILEAVDAGIKLIVTITEGIPVQDMVRVKKVLIDHQVTMIGPNCPGLITPGETKLGITPGTVFTPGPVGFVSRSGTLTYQVVDELTRAGLGQTTCVGIGGDPINGTSFQDVLRLFRADSATKVVVLVGEIGGTQEEEAAQYIGETGMPVIAFIAGRTAPEGKKMGHAGAIVSGNKGTAAAKVKAFQDVHVPVCETTGEIIERVAHMLKAPVPR